MLFRILTIQLHLRCPTKKSLVGHVQATARFSGGNTPLLPRRNALREIRWLFLGGRPEADTPPVRRRNALRLPLVNELPLRLRDIR